MSFVVVERDERSGQFALEVQILGALIGRGATARDIAGDAIRPEHFVEPMHARLFQGIRYRDGRALLSLPGPMDDGYVHSLVTLGAPLAALPDLVAKLRAAWICRKLDEADTGSNN